MARTHEKVGNAPLGSSLDHTPESAAAGLDAALRTIDGRWKTIILFHLFDKGTLRYSELERAIPGVSQKMLGQQLRELEADGLVGRTVHPEVPPRVEYWLTHFGQRLCPALDALLGWIESKQPDDREAV